MTTIPQWLNAAHAHEHIVSVITTLAQRERTRDSARGQSRRRASSSGKSGIKERVSARAAILPGRSSVDEKLVQHYAVAAGCQPNNQNANRYIQLEPYDRTRVVVGAQPGASGIEEDEGRYINASWVRERAGGKWWIATQAPLPNTVHAFLSILLQPTSPPAAISGPSKPARVRTVVQLTRNIESGMQKAHLYFPAEVGDHWVIHAEDGHGAPSLKVTLLDVREIKEAQCVQSTVSIAAVLSQEGAETEPVIFQHLLYAAWPDHGAPLAEERPGLLNFARLVQDVNRDTSRVQEDDVLDPDPPIMVGCSAGIGRTGSFIALCSLLRAYRLLATPSSSHRPLHSPNVPPSLPPSPLGPLPQDLEADLVAQEIDSLREQRCGMVQREEQILLIYETLALAFIQHGAIVPGE